MGQTVRRKGHGKSTRLRRTVQTQAHKKATSCFVFGPHPDASKNTVK